MGVAALLGAFALLASFVPARRAARVNPVEALRAERAAAQDTGKSKSGIRF
jgi:hypothetical protein